MSTLLSNDYKEELKKESWNLMQDLRGNVDIWDFQEYVLGLLFYRYLSEDLTNYINEAERECGNEDFDYALLMDDEVEEFKEDLIEEKGFFIYPSQLFENIRKNSKEDEDLSLRLSSVFKSIEESSKELESEKSFKGLLKHIDFDSIQLGSNEIQRNLRLSSLLEKIGSIGQENNFEVNKEILRDFFTFLLDEIASYSGKRGGEYYTPPQVSELLTLLATDGKERIRKIYDPTCGTGSLLLKAVDVFGNDNIRVGFYGQELNSNIYDLARMNMIIHNIPFDKFVVAQGDTLTQPKHWNDEPFDVIVSNPPINLRWEGKSSSTLANDERFTIAGALAPSSRADLAFIMHSLFWLSDSGTAAITCAPGVLFRGGAEEKIRKYLINNNFIDAIIQLPRNLFYGTGMAMNILVLKKGKEDNNILFINASDYYVKNNHENELSQKDIDKIIQIFRDRKDIEGISKLVTREQIEEENYNLSVSLYTSPIVTQSFENGRKLKDLLVNVQMGNFRTSSKSTGEDNAYLININNLNNNMITSSEELPTVSSDNLRKTLEFNDIVLSRNLNAFKGGINMISDSDKPIIAGGNTYILRVNQELIDPIYLLYFLTSSAGKDQLIKGTSTAAMLPTYQARTLENIEVPVIEMEKQKKIAERYLKLLEEKEQIEKQLAEKKKELVTFSIDEN